MKLTGENRRTRGKTCPSATLSTTYPTWTDPGLNRGLRGERPATNRLSQGTALITNSLLCLMVTDRMNLLCCGLYGKPHFTVQGVLSYDPQDSNAQELWNIHCTYYLMNARILKSRVEKKSMTIRTAMYQNHDSIVQSYTGCV
jgi:hypothetical protein